MSPELPSPSRSGRRRFESKPSVLSWYRFYCGTLAVLYLLLAAAGGFVLTRSAEQLGPEHADAHAGGVLLLLLGVPLCALFALQFFAGRKPWAWVLGIVLICIGFTSLCCLPVSIILLLQWLKPPVKEYFGREARPARRIADAPIRPRSSSRRGGGRRGRRR